MYFKIIIVLGIILACVKRLFIKIAFIGIIIISNSFCLFKNLTNFDGCHLVPY